MNNQILLNLKELANDYRFLLCTDMYQLTMNAVYMAENRHNEEVVFECFVRNVREKVNPQKDVYYFSGEKEVHKMMYKIKKIFKDVEMVQKMRNDFKELVIPKVGTEQKEFMIKAIDKAFGEKVKIEYTVMKENTPITPLVPVFMFKGSRWIGQLIETMVTNIINGKTGYNTLKREKKLEQNVDNYLKNITLGIFDEQLPNVKLMNEYREKLVARAKEYKKELKEGQTLTDASYRRAPSFYSAFMSADVALENNWFATSNTTLFFTEGKEVLGKIGGSFAHSFVMGHDSEQKAFETWLKYYPNTVLLIDSYDVANAVKIITENRLNTGMVRIDSEPLDKYAVMAAEKFKEAGLDIKIYLSSDITPEILRGFNESNIPCDRVMAGTKYVNCGYVENINCGFVYKITVNSINGKTNYPEKKATGKMNYSGYKFVVFGENEIVMHYANGGNNVKFGFRYNAEVGDVAKVLKVEKV